MIVFKSEAARDACAAWTQRFRDKLPGPLEDREIQTKFGRTHVLLAGPVDAPPLLLVHGAMASSAHALSELKMLARTRRVYAVDVLGQSVLSDDARLPMTREASGAWIEQVLDGLGLTQVDLVGISWGGYLSSRAASVLPHRLHSLTLLVPAGFIATPFLPALRALVLPMMGWKLLGREASLHAMTQALFTTQDPDWVGWIGLAMRSYRDDFTAPPLATDTELATWTGPTLVMGADQDLSFPGEALLARVKQLWPRAQTELIQNSRHAPPFEDSFRAWVCERVLRFIEESSSARKG